jgi:hypothetical protein
MNAHKRGFFSVYADPNGSGWQLTWERGDSRRLLPIASPQVSKASEGAPVAAESFSMDPDHYRALLDRASEAVREGR